MFYEEEKKKRGGNTMTEKVEKKKKERIEEIPTHIPGVTLRAEPEFQLTLPKKAIEAFLRVAKKFAKIKFQTDEAAKQQSLLRNAIIKIAKDYDGLRGIISRNDNFQVTSTQRGSNNYDFSLLKESTGLLYPNIVTEELAIHISIPAGFADEATLKTAVERGLLGLGIFGPEELSKIMYVEISQSVNEKRLEELLERGQVKLLPGTKITDIVWSVKPEKLK